MNAICVWKSLKLLRGMSGAKNPTQVCYLKSAKILRGTAATKNPKILQEFTSVGSRLAIQGDIWCASLS